MADSVSFKAYLKRNGQDVEVRRFGVDSGAATSYMYLRGKVQAMFPSIQNDQFQVFWEDAEHDFIRMDSDEELVEALTASNQQPLKIYIHVQNGQGSSGPSGTTGREHPGVVCDGCEGAVVGYRYKCITCPDFDLCSRCEASGAHGDHFMLRMPTPMDSALRHPKFIRKLFSHPHKFHKRHEWSRPGPPRGCGDSQAGARGPRCPAMGDEFLHVLDLIENLPSFGGEAGIGQTCSAATNQNVGSGANQTAGTEGPQTQTQGPSQSQSQPQPQPERREGRGVEYLNNIGQMVAAILDPLDHHILRPKRKWMSKQPGHGHDKFIGMNKFGKGRMNKMVMKTLGKHDSSHGPRQPMNAHHFRHSKKHSHGPRRPMKNDHHFRHSKKHSTHCHRRPMNNDHHFGHSKNHSTHCRRLSLKNNHPHFVLSGMANRTGPICSPIGHLFGRRSNKFGQKFGKVDVAKPNPTEIVIDDDSDIEIVFEDIGVDVTFDVRTKTSQQASGSASTDPSPAPTPAPAQTPNTPAQAPPAPQTFTAPTQTPTTSVQLPSTPAQVSTAPPAAPAAAPFTFNAFGAFPAAAPSGPVPRPAPEVPATTQTDAPVTATVEVNTDPARERRNSDDWTLLNRESPTRGEATAMDVDESQGAKPKTPGTEAGPSPSAPPQDDLSEHDRKRIQDALETFRSMGFNFNPNTLRELLKKQNCDIFSVLEIMLNAEKK